jgi:hypothetical protein
MKRLMLLSSAFMLLGGAYALWLEQRRHRRMEEHARNLQVWESEGGRPMGGNAETTGEPSLDSQQSKSAYS